jgi:hypothetical protein
MIDKARTLHWGRQIDAVMLEIGREATICKIRLLDPGVIEAVMQNNESVCGSSNPRAFTKLRQLLMMGTFMRGKAYDQLGPVEADALIAKIREQLRGHFGDKLGGPASPG